MNTGNTAAYKGHVLIDSIMISCGECSYAAAFHVFDSIEHYNAYTQIIILPFPIRILIFTNYFRVPNLDQKHQQVCNHASKLGDVQVAIV